MSSDPALTTAPVTEVLSDVALVRYPLRLGARANEHYEAVFRELALLAASEADGPQSVPGRLIGLIDALGRRYARNNEHEKQREEALERGEKSIDLLLRVPGSVADAGKELDALLDVADTYCRDGTLLTLQAADDVVSFRRWYLRELTEQLGGRAATPWPGALR